MRERWITSTRLSANVSKPQDNPHGIDGTSDVRCFVNLGNVKIPQNRLSKSPSGSPLVSLVP